MTVELLLDNSAWARLGEPSLPSDRTEDVAGALEDGQIAVCLPFVLEAGYSARSGRDHSELIEELMALPVLAIDRDVERRAVDAQSQLARAGHHRLPPVDTIVAAIAERHAVGVLHYDADYDVIGSKTDLRFNGVWLAPRGSL